MAEEKLLTVREVSIVLGISEKQVMDLAETGSLPAYKIGGVYLRFKKDQLHEFVKSAKFPSSSKRKDSEAYPLRDKIRDFFYFNDFYILSVMIISLLLFIILRGN